MKKFFTTSLTIAIICYLNSSSFAVSLPSIIGNHMVLQQNQEVTIWGWGKPLEEIKVTASWSQKEVKTIADNKAHWKVVLNTPAAGGPYSIKVQGYNTIDIEDVLIGEVWLCSGQSNMEMTPSAGIDKGEQEIKDANHPEIRFFTVDHRTAENPQIDLDGEWVVCTPETMKYFSAVAYFFGEEIQNKMNVPVGLINSSWGGTPAEIWMSKESVENDAVLKSANEKMEEMKWGPKEPGLAYNAMIAPLSPFRIKGTLWYQGESNTYSPQNYTKLLTALISNWREKWGYEFPFYYVQIAPFNYGRPQEGVLLRDAQRKAMTVANTGMVVISDIGNKDNIHPTNKKDVGLRLANWALNKTYGFNDVPYSGPAFTHIEKEGKKVRIFFDHADNGLVCKGDALTEFQIAGEDKQFVDAKAKIDGSTVVVYAKSVKDPVAVRFGWSNTSEPNLFNSEGLPASCFRSDDWQIVLDK